MKILPTRPSRRVLKRTAVVSIVAATISISISTGVRIVVGAEADGITVLVRIVLPFLIAVPLALIWFTRLEALEKSYKALLRKASILAKQASTDPLTGLLNRRSFIEQFELAAGHQVPGIFLVADVDFLKSINDLHGHSVGDVAILAVASAMQATLGDESLIGRIGGDEFCAFVPGPHGDQMEIWSETISAAATIRFREASGLTGERLTITIGAVPCDAGKSFKTVMEAADAKLYGKKRTRTATAEMQLRERILNRPDDRHQA